MKIELLDLGIQFGFEGGTANIVGNRYHALMTECFTDPKIAASRLQP